MPQVSSVRSFWAAVHTGRSSEVGANAMAVQEPRLGPVA